MDFTFNWYFLQSQKQRREKETKKVPKTERNGSQDKSQPLDNSFSVNTHMMKILKKEQNSKFMIGHVKTIMVPKGQKMTS